MTALQSGFNLFARSGLAASPPANLYERVHRPPGDTGATFVLVSGTAYFVYCGRAPHAFTPKYVEFFVSALGTGAQTAEVGIFYSTAPPGKTALSILPIVTTSTVDTLIASAGTKRNTNAFSTVIQAETYVWAGIRTALASTQPTCRGFEYDWGQGYVLSTAGSGALTGAGPWTGALTGSGINTSGPMLRIVDD